MRLKSALEGLVPDVLVRATRPLRSFFHPQRRFDRRLHVDTTGIVEPEALGVEPSKQGHASGYEPTPRSAFVTMFERLAIEPQRYVFLDLGSGKGAALLYATEYPFKRIIGVEFSPELHRIAQRNVAGVRRVRTPGHPPVECVCMDVVDYPFPEEPTILFLFNPFKGQVLDAVIANLERSLRDHPREVIVIYYHPLSRHPGWDEARFERTLREKTHTVYWFHPEER